MALANLATLLAAGVAYENAQPFLERYGANAMTVEEAVMAMGGFKAPDGATFSTIEARDAYINDQLAKANDLTGRVYAGNVYNTVKEAEDARLLDESNRTYNGVLYPTVESAFAAKAAGEALQSGAITQEVYQAVTPSPEDIAAQTALNERINAFTSDLVASGIPLSWARTYATANPNESVGNAYQDYETYVRGEPTDAGASVSTGSTGATTGATTGTTTAPSVVNQAIDLGVPAEFANRYIGGTVTDPYAIVQAYDRSKVEAYAENMPWASQYSAYDAGNAAQQLANEIMKAGVGLSNAVRPPPGLSFDLNGSGSVDAADALLALKGQADPGLYSLFLPTPIKTDTATSTTTGATGATETTSTIAPITTDQAKSVFNSVFGRDPNQTELSNFQEAQAGTSPFVTSSQLETYLKGTPDYAAYLASKNTQTGGLTGGVSTVVGATGNDTITGGVKTDTVTGGTKSDTTTVSTTNNLTIAQAKSIFQNLFGRQPNSTELANFVAAQSGASPFTTSQGLETYLRGAPEYATYLQSLQSPTTSGFTSVPQTFGGAFSVPVTPMAGPSYFEVGGAPVMETSALAGPEIRRRTQQRLGEGFTKQQLTDYAISQGLSPDVIRYAFGEDVTLPDTIQTGLTPTFRSGAAGFTNMRPSSLEFGTPAVSQAVQQYTPGVFDKAALQAVYEQATGQTYGGENVDQMQLTGNWEGGKVTKDKIAYEKGGKVRGLLGPNPDNPDDGYGSLQVGEYVIRKKAVNKYGEDFLEALNESRLPKKKAKSLL